MILEATQVLSTNRPDIGFWKPAFVHHPAVKWAAEPDNYLWLYDHLTALLQEYEFRFGKQHTLWYPTALLMPPNYAFSIAPDVTHLKLTRDISRGIDCTSIENVYTSYKYYLYMKWQTDRTAVKFTRRGAPEWMKDIDLISAGN